MTITDLAMVTAQEHRYRQDVHMGLEHTERERKRCVDGHDPQEAPRASLSKLQWCRTPSGAPKKPRPKKMVTQQRDKASMVEHAVEFLPFLAGSWPPLPGNSSGYRRCPGPLSSSRDDGPTAPYTPYLLPSRPSIMGGDQRDQRAQAHGHIDSTAPSRT